jgi:hypothetical protein
VLALLLGVRRCCAFTSYLRPHDVHVMNARDE